MSTCESPLTDRYKKAILYSLYSIIGLLINFWMYPTWQSNAFLDKVGRPYGTVFSTDRDATTVETAWNFFIYRYQTRNNLFVKRIGQIFCSILAKKSLSGEFQYFSRAKTCPGNSNVVRGIPVRAIPTPLYVTIKLQPRLSTLTFRTGEPISPTPCQKRQNLTITNL